MDHTDSYDSNGNELPCVKDNEFDQFEASIDEISGDENSLILQTIVLPTSSHPNWQVDPYMIHLNKAFIQEAVLPAKLGVDEQTIQFHGASKLKSHMKHKKTGDGFQCDSICSN